MTKEHPDLNEIHDLIDANMNARDYCKAMKAAARRRNSVAHYHLGNWHMTGLWDIKGMEDDWLLGKLKPETSDPQQDFGFDYLACVVYWAVHQEFWC